MRTSGHLACALLACILLRTTSASVNFDTCLAEVQAGKYGLTGGTDNAGNPVSNISQATSVTYSMCLTACGSGAEPFVWNVFSTQFSSWLLPWLALISQLPFGANDKLENLLSMLLSVGSPVLAAYSLALTVLNGHWIARRFSRHSYPNIRNAVRILSSLQQAPLQVTTQDSLLASLVVLPENDEWWTELVLWLDYTHTWSISAVASIAWVVIAYIFTVVDSFTGDIITSINANGQGVGSLWLWLLPVVIGWLQLSPKCDSDRLQQAIERANEIAFVATHDGESVHAATISTFRAISLRRGSGTVHRDEQCTAPVYNYARFFPWAQAVEEVYIAFREASENAARHEPVNTERPWKKGDRALKVRPENRRGSLPQVRVYCMDSTDTVRSRWGGGVFSRFFVASVLALSLQWATTGSAIIVNWFTPTTGLGCRSGSYLLYGVASTLVWILLVTSSVLAHYSTVTSGPKRFRRRDSAAHIAGVVSVILRRLGKVLASINAIWLVMLCLFQFSNFYDRCYCNSSVTGRRGHAYDVIQLVAADISEMRQAWIGGVILAGGCASLFVAFVNIFIDPRLPEG